MLTKKQPHNNKKNPHVSWGFFYEYIKKNRYKL